MRKGGIVLLILTLLVFSYVPPITAYEDCNPPFSACRDAALNAGDLAADEACWGPYRACLDRNDAEREAAAAAQKSQTTAFTAPATSGLSQAAPTITQPATEVKPEEEPALPYTLDKDGNLNVPELGLKCSGIKSASIAKNPAGGYTMNLGVLAGGGGCSQGSQTVKLDGGNNVKLNLQIPKKAEPAKALSLEELKKQLATAKKMKSRDKALEMKLQKQINLLSAEKNYKNKNFMPAIKEFMSAGEYSKALDSAKKNYQDKKTALEKARGTRNEKKAEEEYLYAIKKYQDTREEVSKKFAYDSSKAKPLIDPSKATDEQKAQMAKDKKTADNLISSLTADSYPSNFNGKDKKANDLIAARDLLQKTNDPETAKKILDYLAKDSSSKGDYGQALNDLKFLEQKALDSKMPKDSGIMQKISELKTDDLVVNGEFQNAQSNGMNSGVYLKNLEIDPELKSQIMKKVQDSAAESNNKWLEDMAASQKKGVDESSIYGSNARAALDDPKGPFAKLANAVSGNGDVSDVIPTNLEDVGKTLKQGMGFGMGVIGDVTVGAKDVYVNFATMFMETKVKTSEERAEEARLKIDNDLKAQKESYAKFSNLDPEDAQNILEIASRVGEKGEKPVTASYLDKYGLKPSDLLNLKNVNDQSRNELYTKVALLNAKDENDAMAIDLLGKAKGKDYEKEDVMNAAYMRAGINPEEGGVGGFWSQFGKGILSPVTSVKDAVNMFRGGDAERFVEEKTKEQEGMVTLAKLIRDGNSDINEWKGESVEQTIANLKDRGIYIDPKSQRSLQIALNSEGALEIQRDQSYASGDNEWGNKLQSEVLEKRADYYSKTGETAMAIDALSMASQFNSAEKKRYDNQIGSLRTSQGLSDIVEVGSTAGDFMAGAAAFGVIGKGAAKVAEASKVGGFLREVGLIEKVGSQAAQEARLAEASKLLESMENRGLATNYLYGKIPKAELDAARAAFEGVQSSAAKVNTLAGEGNTVLAKSEMNALESSMKKLKSLAEKNDLGDRFLYKPLSEQAAAAKQAIKPLEMFIPVTKEGAVGTIKLGTASAVGGIAGEETGGEKRGKAWEEAAVPLMIYAETALGGFKQGLNARSIDSLSASTDYGKSSAKALEKFSSESRTKLELERSKAILNDKAYDIKVNDQNKIILSRIGEKPVVVDNMESLGTMKIVDSKGEISDLNRQVSESKTNTRNEYARTELEKAKQDAIKAKDSSRARQVENEMNLLDSGKKTDLANVEAEHAKAKLIDAIEKGKPQSEILRLENEAKKKSSAYQESMKEYYSRAEERANSEVDQISSGLEEVKRSGNKESERQANQILADKRAEAAELSRLKKEADYRAKKDGGFSAEEIVQARDEALKAQSESIDAQIEKEKTFSESLKEAKEEAPWYDFLKGSNSDRSKIDRQIGESEKRINDLETSKNDVEAQRKSVGEANAKANALRENIDTLKDKVEMKKNEALENSGDSEKLDGALEDIKNTREQISALENERKNAERLRDEVITEAMENVRKRAAEDLSEMAERSRLGGCAA